VVPSADAASVAAVTSDTTLLFTGCVTRVDP
jgi:hypothetical protein